MRKIIISLLFVIFVCANLTAKKIFVEMEFYKKCIKLDDGTNKKRQIIKDEHGKDIRFISLVGALNYMSLQGWNLEETKSVTSGARYDGASETSTKVYYIFSRDVSDEELRQVVNKSYREE